MKKIAVFIVFLFGVGLLGGPVLAGDAYSERVETHYEISWDGSANMTIITTLYGPGNMLNQTKESILKQGVENASQLYLKQEVQKLAQKGINLENGSVEFEGYNSTGPLKIIVRGKALGVAKYYTYGKVWEIDLDLLRTAELSQINPTKLNQTLDLDNVYVISLPTDANVITIPQNYSVTAGNSYVKIEANRTGNKIFLESHIYLAKGVTMDEINKLYANPRAFVIQYSGHKGSEGNYTVYKLRITNNITVGKEETVMDTVDEYLEPQDYINYLKFQLSYQGEQAAIQNLYRSYAKAFQSQGIGIKGWNISFGNLQSKGPLIVKFHWVLTNYTKSSNGTYTYEYDPTLGLGNIPSLHRLSAEVDQEVTTHITLPNGAKFTEIPNDINVTVNGSSVIMKVEKLSDHEIIIHSRVFLRYGMYTNDYKNMMKEIPTKLEFRYTLSSGGSSICGPAFIVGLAILPLLFIRRRK
ncbi:CGP-CTERM sorting domain-containing protein [Thermococcus sp. Bubb.Bath]|uniref:CGP-CTERM sorting domain-containing protein n=1 Tax=Thermococcus sp. Bubb.Bath TaxID=1638242 RepID=UPI00143A6787|nr:CGP-CTERM sorting domain-containing protein [Thermococcus sp. Bubb.Bath]NJF24082.1 CGP-CTERM sorting domain-containing protein [Thermococcus sp. Bubb.Bath]